MLYETCQCFPILNRSSQSYGKSLRGGRAVDGMVHVINAFATRARIVLAAQAIPDKATEIIAIPGLLAQSDLTGATGPTRISSTGYGTCNSGKTLIAPGPTTPQPISGGFAAPPSICYSRTPPTCGAFAAVRYARFPISLIANRCFSGPRRNIAHSAIALALPVAQALLGHASVPTTTAYVQTDLSQQYQGCADLRARCLGSAAAIYGAEAVEKETVGNAALKGFSIHFE